MLVLGQATVRPHRETETAGDGRNTTIKHGDRPISWEEAEATYPAIQARSVEHRGAGSAEGGPREREKAGGAGGDSEPTGVVNARHAAA